MTATLVGAGPEEAALRAQVARLSLQNAVRFLPAMAAREAMTHGRIMVIPSRAESLPYVVLEAAAARKPLITTDVGGIPEIFGAQSGLLVPPGNSDQLADAIEDAIKSPAAFGNATGNLRARVAAAFSLNAMVDGVVSGYVTAIERVPVLSQALLSTV